CGADIKINTARKETTIEIKTHYIVLRRRILRLFFIKFME
ncbi:hypothetical protein HMPREF3215_00534, partial [Staphylococcus simulans]